MKSGGGERWKESGERSDAVEQRYTGQFECKRHLESVKDCSYVWQQMQTKGCGSCGAENDARDACLPFIWPKVIAARHFSLDYRPRALNASQHLPHLWPYYFTLYIVYDDYDCIMTLVSGLISRWYRELDTTAIIAYFIVRNEVWRLNKNINIEYSSNTRM